jgi:hypothetical protein
VAFAGGKSINMFNTICIRNQSQTESSIDLGFLAEAILFYPDVQVIATKGIIEQLARACGPEVLLEFLQRRYLTISYEHQLLGIRTRNSGTGDERHSAITFSSPQHDLGEVAPNLLFELTGRSGKARRLANRFLALVKPLQRSEHILTDFRSDVLDADYIQSLIRSLCSSCAPEYPLPDPLVFEIRDHDQEFEVLTNINFEQLNRSYHLRVSPSHSSMTPAYLLSHILTARDNLFFASTLDADLAISPVASHILVTKIGKIIARSQRNMSQLATFQDFVFNDGRAIAECINSGEKSFSDLLDIREKADRFRAWLKGKAWDADLTKDYFAEVTHSSWIDKLQGKTFRWSIFTTLGLTLDALGGGGIGTALGLGISAADSFLLERIIKGWKPNQFVNGPLSEFVTHH